MNDLLDPYILRAGIIPYFKVPNVEDQSSKTLFIFGLDEGISCLSDFGGTREYFDTNVYDLALREYNEESIGLLEPITINSLKTKSTYIIDETKIKKGEKCALFFYPIDYPYPILDKMRLFKERSMPGDETKGIIALTRDQLILALKQEKTKIENTKMFLFHPKIKYMLSKHVKNLHL